MIRRNARLRREYIFKKSEHAHEVITEKKKKLIKQAMLEGKPIPTELRYEERKLSNEVSLDNDDTIDAGLGIDDEYAMVGSRDPKIVVTTSRDPSSRLLQFVKELDIIIPNTQRINRGTHIISELVDACRTADVTDLLIVHEHRGQPDGLVISHLPYGPTAYFGVVNTVLRHDVETQGHIPEQYPQLIFHNMRTPLGIRVRSILQALFPVPKPDSKRVITFYNHNDYISFRHHSFARKGKDVELEEMGPRFELRLFKIKLGTVEMKDADEEFALHSFVRSAKKAKLL
ncbi:MAG: putative U3 small nucleolar ribonucleoprotein IMP4 [Streblomastix strix]|uniref:Putative U3 small nucleolar ribonucleoprotein IMP4 n=1 Tax=Streblomastix strix TaxID=222440 RepID=A0A5J4V370_9EUKA|nr:MAG: putative U3 small nucleolar ribonucleoprotein IMP4 [Streblomastix strix]